MYPNNVVYKVKINGLDEIVFSDSFYFVNMWFYEFPSLEIIIKNRAFRVNCNYLYFRVLFLKIFPCSAQCATGTYSGNKIIYFPIRLFPYLRSSSVVMRINISGIFVLIWIVRVWSFSGYSFGNTVITFG